MNDELRNAILDYIAGHAQEIYDDACDCWGSELLSDYRLKCAHDLASKEQLSPNELRTAAWLMGPSARFGSPFDNSSSDSDDWSDDMVREYADNLRNYLYTYKPEAVTVDPRIDPNEEHRGPMAQDIEKVAPDCVHETPEGIKKVDGNRLALVNAGVIGDLARRLLVLEEQVYGR